MVHAATHGVGALLSAAGLVVLVATALDTGSALTLLAAVIYGLTLLFCYVSSALYHGVSRPDLKRLFLLLDHCAIFLLIAGTYTPIVLLVPLRAGWWLAIAVWAAALLGIGFKVQVYRNGSLARTERISVLLYLAMGWAGLFVGREVVHHLPWGGVVLLLAGGMIYSLGVVAFLAQHLRFHHALWHVLVLTASACHFWLMWSYVLPGRLEAVANNLM